MPFYTYRCSGCDDLTKRLVRIPLRNEPQDCDLCGEFAWRDSMETMKRANVATHMDLLHILETSGMCTKDTAIPLNFGKDTRRDGKTKSFRTVGSVGGAGRKAGG